MTLSISLYLQTYDYAVYTYLLKTLHERECHSVEIIYIKFLRDKNIESTRYLRNK